MKIKRQILTAIKLLAKNDVIWFFIKPVISVARAIYNERERLQTTEQHIENFHPNIFDNLTVLNGPFKGMRYPRMLSKGSTLYPKLLGSYERELHPILLEFQQNNYSEILDVGCAEGYFAIGTAMNFKCEKLYAYDLDTSALEACREMALLNGVADKIETHPGLSADALGSFSFSDKGLIICDCEGFEKELFNEKNISNLTNCDLIIETHDLFDIEISTYLKNIISPTHSIETILSTDDINKAVDCDYPELVNMSLEEKKKILAEERPAIMKWLICRPLN